MEFTVNKYFIVIISNCLVMIQTIFNNATTFLLTYILWLTTETKAVTRMYII